MRLLKKIVLLLGVLFLIGSIYLASLNGSYDVKHSRMIKASETLIFNDLIEFKNWEEWAPWYEKDRAIQVSYGDKTQGVGASYSWVSEVENNGHIQTVSSEKTN